MITELLIGLLFNFNFQDKFYSNSNREVRIEKPSPPAKPIFSISEIQESLNTPKPSKTPRPSRAPRTTFSSSPSSTPKPASITEPSVTPSVSPQTLGITTQSVLAALNNYRNKNGSGPLTIDEKLQDYAQSRADYLKSIGKLDNHAKHQEFMANDGFGRLGFNAIAENQSYNYKGSAQSLIENFYGKSSGHNKNQLNPEYTHVGIGIAGPFTNLVFGGRKR